jgi:1,4-alpha-glucan branching enzyme
MNESAERTWRLIAGDPILEPYEKALFRRLEKIREKETILTRDETSLMDFASGHEFFGLQFR